MNPSTRRSNLLSMLLGAVLVGLVFVALAIAGVFDGTERVQTVTEQTPASETADAPSAAPGSVSDIYRRVSPGVVFVTASATQRTPLAPGEGGQASGSGFLIDRDGYIVTNEHVVDGANRVTVRFGEEGEPIPARVVGTDPSTDIALLKVDPGEIDGGPRPLELGSSRNLQPGDAAINPGNSGGPLLDGHGRVIGVNSQIATNSGANSGVGFAVPIDTVKEIVPDLRSDGRVEHAWLGVSTSESTQRDGAVVQTVTSGGPAADAGIRPDDRIVELDGDRIRTPEDLSAAVGARESGDEVGVVIERDGQRRTLDVTLGTRPAELPRS